MPALLVPGGEPAPFLAYAVLAPTAISAHAASAAVPDILVIDDEHAIRDAIAYTLQAAGYQVTEAATGDDDRDAVANTAQFTAAIEALIRRYPDQWLWIHRRWKTRPEGEPLIY